MNDSLYNHWGVPNVAAVQWQVQIICSTKGLLLHIPVPSNYMISITEFDFFFGSKTHPLQNHVQYRDIG